MIAVRAFLEDVGAPGVIGLGLLVFSLSLALGAVLPAYEELQFARAQYERLERAGTLASDEAGKGDVRRELARFLQHFPPADDARQDILRLQAFAADHGIELRSGEYRFAPERGIDLVRHQVTFPVTGPYLDIRAFIAQALEQLPAAALESVSFRRDSQAARAVEARLQFALYTRAS